jgi:Cu/Ag efflux protein CusF
MVVCVAAVALTAAQVARAAEEKAGKKETLSGKIAAVDTAASTIAIKHKKETKTFTVAPDCTFGGVGEKKVTLADLKIGDAVKVVYTQEGDKMVAHHIGHVDVKKKAEEAPPAK